MAAQVNAWIKKGAASPLEIELRDAPKATDPARGGSKAAPPQPHRPSELAASTSAATISPSFSAIPRWERNKKRQQEQQSVDQQQALSVVAQSLSLVAASMQGALTTSGSGAAPSAPVTTQNGLAAPGGTGNKATEQLTGKQLTQPSHLCIFFKRGTCHNGSSCNFLHTQATTSTPGGTGATSASDKVNKEESAPSSSSSSGSSGSSASNSKSARKGWGRT
jgi:Zinc finger C-x8-C-x5-C-x3-H type (and similar)